jgi:PAS domain S-box-containing protein
MIHSCEFIKKGETVIGMERMLQKRDNTIATILANYAPVKDAKGSVTHVIAAWQDITERKQAEDQLTYQANLLAIANDAIIACDHKEQITFWNPAAERMYGWKASEALGKTSEDLLLPVTTAREQQVKAERRILFEQGDTLQGECIMHRKDHSPFWVEYTSRAFIEKDGRVSGYVAVHRDITERKSLEQQKNNFLSLASHELRTPITTIQGLAEILQLCLASGQPLDSPRSVHAISSIAEQSHYLTRLIEEMLDLSRLDQAQLLLHLAPHDLLRTLVRVIESQAVTTKQHEIHLVPDGLPASETLIGFFDEERIIQVLSNLISNAIKYSPRGGLIEIGLEQTLERPDEALIWVRDRGIGIPAEALPHIFERFYRASKLEQAMSGLGIGLYLAKEIIARHEGRIWVESVEGAGSTFYVLLPLGKLS